MSGIVGTRTPRSTAARRTDCKPRGCPPGRNLVASPNRSVYLRARAGLMTRHPDPGSRQLQEPPMSDPERTPHDPQPDPDSAGLGEPSPDEGAQRPDPSPANSDGGSSKGLTCGGVAVAILLMLLARGGKFLARKAAEDPEPRPKIMLAAQDERQAERVLQGLQRWQAIETIRQ